MNLKSINYSNEKGGIKPAVRKAVKDQALKYYNIDLSNFEVLPDGKLGMPVAIDENSNKVIYLKIEASVGFAGKEKAKSPKVSEPVVVPNLFD